MAENIITVSNEEIVEQTPEQRMTEQNQIVRAAVNTVYDIQKLRIATGNRIIQSFMRQANVHSGETIDDMDAEVRKMITIIMEEHTLVANAYIEIFQSKGRIAKAIKYLGTQLVNIKTETDYQMISIYQGLVEQEKEATKIVNRVVSQHPIWDAFLKDVVGCGPLMSAVCISRLDPYKARHASSFWRYAGLDTVWESYNNGERITIDPSLFPTEAAETGGMIGGDTVELTKHLRVEWSDGREPYDEDVIDAEADEDGISVTIPGASFTFPMKEKDKVIKPTKKNGLSEPSIIPGAAIIDFEIVDLEEEISVPNGRYVGRSKRHLIDREYVSKTGETLTKKSISYNPFLKTKLMGVLADSFIKCPGSKYERIYRGYRSRLDNSPRHYGKTDAHKHMMAKRYAVKMFLMDLWVAWRTIEGLPVSDPYAVDKLGMQPHGFNF